MSTNVNEEPLKFESTAHGQIAELTRKVAELEARARLLEATLETLVDGVVIMDPNGQLLFSNAAAGAIVGVPEGEPSDRDVSQDWVGEYGIFGADGVTRLRPEEFVHFRALRGEETAEEEVLVRNAARPDGVWLRSRSNVLRTDGKIEGATIVFRDISERKRWEEELQEQLEREREKNETLQRLRFAVQELSTPVLEVWDDVLALPVVGIVDSRRSVEMMDRLLDAVTQKQCRFVIIDITGVEVVDTATADRFIKLVRAVELLGARCLLTGVRSAVAQTLVNLGLDLGPLLTLRTLKHGLRECLRAMDTEPQRVDPKALLLRQRFSV